jgi:trimeric autotransporter adhesin
MKTSNHFKQPPKLSGLFIALILVCFALSDSARGVSPPPDGGYAGGNTAEGENALFRLTTGVRNTATGFEALFSNTTGNINTANGFQALHDNTAGRLNTAIGYQTLYLNTTGEANTATGFKALIVNATGINNTANGADALGNNTTGDNNTATGSDALFNNTTGNSNTSNGANALENNTTGSRNAANGFNALQHNTTGDANVALGSFAGSNATTGDGNVYIGSGMDGVVGEARHTYIRNINSTPVSGGGTEKVTVNLATGLLGHETSSRRYKQDIKPMDNVSQTLFALKPVTYHYKKEIDPSQSPAFGLIAEEVAEVNPNLVAHDSQGKPESVHYEMVNAMLLNEFLKEHQTVQELKKQVAEISAMLQEVSAQVQLNKPAPQTVSNDQ